MDLITNLGQFLLSVAFLILIIVLHMLLLKASLQLVELWIEFHKLNLMSDECFESKVERWSNPFRVPIKFLPSAVNDGALPRHSHV